MEKLLDDLKSDNNRIVTARLQLIIFYLEKEDTNAREVASCGLLSSLNTLLNHESLSVQAWSLLAISVLCLRDSGSEKQAPGELAEAMISPILWQQSWNIALRRLSNASTARTACLLLCTYTKASRIDSSQTLGDLEAAARNIEMEGPPFPSDTACEFLCMLLEFASSDARLYRLNIHDKVFTFVSNHWTFLQSPSITLRTLSHRLRWQPVSVARVLHFLTHLSLNIPIKQCQDQIVFPDSVITLHNIKSAEQRPLHDWFFHAKLPVSRKVANLDTSDKQEGIIAKGSYASASNNAIAVRILAYLRRALESALIEIETGDEVYWAGMAAERLRRIVDLAALALLYEAAIDTCDVIRSETNVRVGIQILQQVAKRIRIPKWTSADRSFLLLGFSPLILEYADYDTTFEAIVEAGEHSGIRKNLLSSGIHTLRAKLHNAECLLLAFSRVDTPKEDIASMATLLRHLWENQELRRGMNEIAVAFEKLLSMDGNGDSAALVKGDDQDFGPTGPSTSVQLFEPIVSNTKTEMGSEACLDICTRFLVTNAFYEEGGEQPARLRRVVKNQLDGTGSHFVLLGRHILNAVQSGNLQLTASELDRMLERLGAELLPSYEYGRAEEMQLLVLQFLQATIRTWGKEERMDISFVDNARKLSAWFTAQYRIDNISSLSIRIALIKLLAAFHCQEYSQLAWGHESEALACHQGVPLPPTTLLIEMLRDIDFRTRFMVAPAMGHLCSYVHDINRHDFKIWESIANARGFDISVNGFESNITLLLAYGNVIVASDYFRPNAYKAITVYAALSSSKTTTHFIRSLLDSISERLGLGSLAQLYTFLAPYTMAEQIIHRQEGFVLPDPTAFGFENKRDLYEAGFTEVAAMALAGPRPAFFDQICTFAGRPYPLALQQCLPVFIAYKLTLSRTAGVDANMQRLEVEQVAARVLEVAKASGQDTQEIMLSIQDLVITKIFTFIWEVEYDVKTFQRAFANNWPGAMEVILEIVESFEEPFQPNVLSPPDVRLEEVLLTLKSDHPTVAGAMTSEPVVYSILHRLLISVAIPPFVSQQRRLLYNTAICIACCSGIISAHLSLLSLILHRLISFLVEADLLIIASGIFRWTAKQYMARLHVEPDVLNDFGHIMAAAAEALVRASDNTDSNIFDAASQLLRDLEDALEKSVRSGKPNLVKAAKLAAGLWPRAFPLQAQLPLDNFLGIIQDSSVNLSNFQVTSQLLDRLGKRPDALPFPLLSKLLWHLLLKTSPMALKDRSATSASFADLLFLAGARLQAPSLNEITKIGIAMEQSHSQIAATIIREISSMLNHDRLDCVDVAFDTLHSIFSVAPPSEFLSDVLSIIGSPQLVRRPLLFDAPQFSLENLIKGDDWLTKTVSRETWQKEFACLLANFLGASDPFYRQLPRILLHDSALAQRCIPRLVHATLLLEVGVESGTKNIVSSYFERILAAQTACTQDIVDIIVQLRRFKPPHEEGDGALLACDHWLAVPWISLARGAVSVRAYTSGLLFLELAREDNNLVLTTSVSAMREVQQLLYEIYANVDEPDGFYGITPLDVHQGLLRRMHHENRWMDAFSWHGGDYESQDHKTIDEATAAGIVQSLAFTDLGRLAMGFLDPAVTSFGTESLPAGQLFELAWRTEHWDLPLTYKTGTDTSQANLFWALRADQREVDIKKSRNLISEYLSKEMAKLARLESSTSSADEEAVRALLCIREVQKWSECRPLMLESLKYQPGGLPFLLQVFYMEHRYIN